MTQTLDIFPSQSEKSRQSTGKFHPCKAAHNSVGVASPTGSGVSERDRPTDWLDPKAARMGKTKSKFLDFLKMILVSHPPPESLAHALAESNPRLHRRQQEQANRRAGPFQNEQIPGLGFSEEFPVARLFRARAVTLGSPCSRAVAEITPGQRHRYCRDMARMMIDNGPSSGCHFIAESHVQR
jgi:hypothetical protein